MPFDAPPHSTNNPDIFTTRYYEDPNGPFWFYKYCQNAETAEQYAQAFQKEYDHMTKLYEIMSRKGETDTYDRLFPRYHACGRSGSTARPYIAMEYITGRSLEELLSSHRRLSYPSLFCSKTRLRHLFDQLHEAIYWLHEAGIMQIDLHPQNIIVLNNNLDIKLIDFTSCYYLVNPNVSYNVANLRIDPADSPALQLRDACALLFTQLFYRGSAHYTANFSVHHFESVYPALVDCLCERPNQGLFEPPDSLSYFNAWYDSFCSIFS